MREFVYAGFNVDSKGRRVFDAISPHVSGGGRVSLNCRFAQPGRYPRQHSDHLYPSDQFPFAYDVIADPLTGMRDGILKRPDTDPLVIHTQTSSEYWERRGSLVHTDSLGNDLPEHDRARGYLFSSSQHSADPLKGPQTGPHQHPSNPLNTTPLLRGLLDALDDWATDGTLRRRAWFPGVPMRPRCRHKLQGGDFPRFPVSPVRTSQVASSFRTTGPAFTTASRPSSRRGRMKAGSTRSSCPTSTPTATIFQEYAHLTSRSHWRRSQAGISGFQTPPARHWRLPTLRPD